MKDIAKVVFVIIGTFIGAGFASGQEIYIFFFKYGINGLVGITISSLILGIIISKTLKIIKENNIQNYKEFLDIIINKKYNLKIKQQKNKKLTQFINIIVNTFILVTFFIMIAGFGTYFMQQFGLNQLIGSSILALITYVILNTNVKGVVKASEIIVPILIISVIIIGLMNLNNLPLLQIKNYLIPNNSPEFVLEAMLYASYNSILLIPVLITLNKYIKNKKQTTIIGMISALIILIMSVLIFLLLTKVDVDIENIEMQVVYVV